MSYKKVKTTSKVFISDQEKIKKIVQHTISRVAEIVGSTLGPSGRVCLIESDYPGIPNKNTKDGVSVFRSLGADDPYEHLIIEQMRDAASKTATEAGDGTTTSTVLAAAFTEHLLNFCNENKKFSPQRVVRIINKLLKEEMLPYIDESAIKIDAENRGLLYDVARISANGDGEMAEKIIEAFELTGMSENSHVTIQELSGSGGYNVRLIEGFPIPIGYEDSIGKFHTAFINDQANLRSALDNPLFILFDGQINDLIMFQPVLENIGAMWAAGESDFKNVVLVSHGFSESVLTQLAFNFSNPNTINILPITTPMNQIKDSKFNFLNDLAAFTGAKVFGMGVPLKDATPEDFGRNMERFECYRFRSTVVGTPDELDIETRAATLRSQLENPESLYAKMDLEERIGKLTSGIAKIEVFAGSAGELKEKVDRVEDSVCSTRAAIKNGALPGGSRVLLNLCLKMLTYKSENKQEEIVSRKVIAPALLTPMQKILDFELGLFDATAAVRESLKNAISIASVMGVMGGLVAYPRDHQLERQEASAERDFQRTVESPESFVNEANERP